MTDFETSDRDVNRAIRSWLHEDRHEDASRIAGAVLDQVEATPERRAGWLAWRTPIMNKFVAIGLGVAAVVVIGVFLGAQLLGSPGRTGAGGPSPSPTATQEPTPDPTPGPTTWIGIQKGPFVINDGIAGVRITVDIASPGWMTLEGLDAITKDDDGLDPPESIGAALLAWAWPVGTGFNVYGDPCHWSTTIPETPATTPDEIAGAFTAQTLTDATAPVDVTVGGYAGKAITLQVPLTYDLPNSSREERFADCDLSVFGFYESDVDSEPARNAQGAGQIDELWILDVDGAIVIMDAAYSPATPAALVEELRSLAESATFELP
jgi:hypothetical protein